MARCRRQSGFALLMVLMILLVATTLGASYLTSRAHYLAESGLEQAMFLLRTNPDALAGSLSVALGPYTADESGDTYVFWAAAAGSADPEQYTLSSQGYVDGIKQTTSVTVQSHNEFRDLVVSYGPRCYWRLGESSPPFAYDQMNRVHGVYYNGTSLGHKGALIGVADTSAQFDGVDEYVDLGGMDVSGDELTLIAWVRRSTSYAGDKDARIISKADGQGAKDQYWTLGTYENSGKRYLHFRLTITNHPKELKADKDLAPLEPGRWHFCAAVYNGSSMKLYLDGKEVGIKTNVTGWISTDSHISAWIGGNPPKDDSQPWSGNIDEVAVFQKALSQSQLQALYQAKYPEIKVLQWHD